jgi:hypothetical protein
MIDLYLRANTEAEMTAALLSAGVINDEGNPVEGMSVDHIGPFMRVTGYKKAKDKAGEPVFTVAEYPKWHTNLRGSFSDEQLAALEPLSVQPAIPHRVWA